MLNRIIYWINNHLQQAKGYQCFCPTCRYYEKCREEKSVWEKTRN